MHSYLKTFTALIIKVSQVCFVHLITEHVYGLFTLLIDCSKQSGLLVLKNGSTTGFPNLMLQILIVIISRPISHGQVHSSQTVHSLSEEIV